MLVFFVIFVLATLGVIFAKSDSRWYIVLCSVTLATLYLFFEPLEEFDLYRHYEIFSYVEGLEWAELFELNEEYNTSFVALLYNIYLESSPAYIVFLFGLSRFGGAKLLIFVTTLLVYGIPMYIVYSAGKKNGTDNVSINASIIFLLFMINYLDVSGIRNMLAVSIVLLAVYWELVLKKKRILSFFLYVIGILIHNSVCILLLLRLLVLIKNKIWKTLAFLGVVAIIPVALLLHNEGVDFSRLGYVGYLANSILNKLVSFISGDGGSLNIGTITIPTIIMNYMTRIMSGISVLGICINTQKMQLSDRVKKYVSFLLLLLVFFCCSIMQYDLFSRLGFFVVLISAPLLPMFFSNVIGKSIVYVKRRDALVTVMVYVCCVFVYLIYYLMSYRAFDGLLF